MENEVDNGEDNDTKPKLTARRLEKFYQHQPQQQQKKINNISGFSSQENGGGIGDDDDPHTPSHMPRKIHPVLS